MTPPLIWVETVQTDVDSWDGYWATQAQIDEDARLDELDRLAEDEKEGEGEPMSDRINRQDPAWAVFAAGFMAQPWHPDMGWSACPSPQACAEFADAMIRERDRRDREDADARIMEQETS
jgi:hypothetical protein